MASIPPQAFPAEWLKKFSDPYALLGVSVSADERRILKRYRTVAKILHPDSHDPQNVRGPELAGQIFARLVNPAYQKLKQEKDRAETLAMLRFQVRRLHRDGQLNFQEEIAAKLVKLPLQEAEVFYEKAISELSEIQYEPIEQFERITQRLAELNQAYFFVKMGYFVNREKRTGIVSSAGARPIQFKVLTDTPTDLHPDPNAPTENYARRHFERAQKYLEKEAYVQAVQELRDAIKLEPTQSDYHSLLGVAYLKQNLTGMATVHIRQALKLNPKDPVALKHAGSLHIKLTSESPQKTQKKPEPSGRSGFFGLFGSKK
ncbi:hypothetical protein BST81_18860 [Leptolyngbya sp. 'hensonii']|uniref:J domain-containing protein n=1 Tax=Leptolyngbya sp. 'hensonii' TaxID=1922337 RepID=UPI00094FD041|nr:J domain-containing protein [Leptolyngbya sp. 'hensonii']OLP16759.1 hypothetical protein BST81_18860 [Leptolyngbya sp. 'hensonii']